MTKGFKLKRDVVEEFAEACEKVGASQAGKITELMKQFIEEVKTSEQSGVFCILVKKEKI